MTFERAFILNFATLVTGSKEGLESQLDQSQWDLQLFFKRRGLEPEVVLNRVAYVPKLPVIPPYVTIPSPAIRTWLREIQTKFAFNFTTSAPWLPAAAVGDQPIFVHFNPQVTDFGGYPLPIKCLVTIEQYVRLFDEVMPILNKSGPAFPIPQDSTTPLAILTWLRDNQLLSNPAMFMELDSMQLESRLSSDLDLSFALELLSGKHNAPPIWSMMIPQDMVDILGDTIAKRYEAFCYYSAKNTIYVVTPDPAKHRRIEDDVNRVKSAKDTQFPIKKIVASYAPVSLIQAARQQQEQLQIRQAVTAPPGTIIDVPLLASGWTLDTEKFKGLKELTGNEEPDTLLELFIVVVIKNSGSDLHICPRSNGTLIQFRRDGDLQELVTLPPEMGIKLASVVKVRAKLDVANRSIPQDGKITTIVEGRSVDLRVSTVPLVAGESVVLRIIDKKLAGRSIDELQLPVYQTQMLKSAITKDHGLVLVTGPTGSGKTTTLHAWLSSIMDKTSKAFTIEDPVEAELPGAEQIQVIGQADEGMTFSLALRAVLRQDPDIIMVGEIRDAETAELTLRAAITGHMVLSTLHTNDALRSIGRLVDLGIDYSHLADALLMLQGQRLIKTLCSCREHYITNDKAMQAHIQEMLRFAPLKALPGDDTTNLYAALKAGQLPLFKPCACWQCRNTGFRGRKAIMEICVIDTAMKEAILSKSTYSEMLKLGRRRGFRTIFEQGLREYMLGNTDWSQIQSMRDLELIEDQD